MGQHQTEEDDSLTDITDRVIPQRMLRFAGRKIIAAQPVLHQEENYAQQECGQQSRPTELRPKPEKDSGNDRHCNSNNSAEPQLDAEHSPQVARS